jgi:hypothetical protein
MAENKINEQEIAEVLIENTEEISCKKRKRENNDKLIRNKREKLEETFRELDTAIREEEKVYNEQLRSTGNLISIEDLVEQVKGIIEIDKGIKKLNQIDILGRYVYATSFQLRIKKEMEKDLRLTEQTARTKIYREIHEKMMETEKNDNRNYKNLGKMTQRAERLREIIEEIGGKEKIKFLERTNKDTLMKMTKEEIMEFKQKLEKRNQKKTTGINEEWMVSGTTTPVLDI